MSEFITKLFEEQQHYKLETYIWSIFEPHRGRWLRRRGAPLWVQVMNRCRSVSRWLICMIAVISQAAAIHFAMSSDGLEDVISYAKRLNPDIQFKPGGGVCSEVLFDQTHLKIASPTPRG